VSTRCFRQRAAGLDFFLWESCNISSEDFIYEHGPKAKGCTVFRTTRSARQHQKPGRQELLLQIQELIPEDVEFLRRFIEDSPTGLRSSHEQLIEAFAQPYLAKRELERVGLGESDQVKKIDEMIIELNEKFHTGIEEDFHPYLASMISGDLSFLKSTDEDAIRFYRGLAVQYARTNHLKRWKQSWINGGSTSTRESQIH
jgi:hypothetical protein